MRWEAACLWRVLQQNPWRAAGSAIGRAHVGVRHLRAHLFEWYEAEQIHASLRLSDLTLRMLGSAGRDTLHHGGAMTTKGAETKSLLPWVLAVMHDFGENVPFAQELIAAGEALQSYYDLLEATPRIVPHDALQELWGLCQRHVLMSQRAQIQLTPKHHLLLHLTKGTSKHSQQNRNSTETKTETETEQKQEIGQIQNSKKQNRN